MPTGSRPAPAALIFLGLIANLAGAADPSPLPKVADGWSISLVEQAPRIAYPTAIVVAPDGTIYLGQDPMNMPGPVNSPIDSVLAIRPDGSTRVFADKLQSVMGLEWVDGTLSVVHAPFLSSFRDADGDGVAETRVDLVTGLGPKVPGFNGLNDHVASGVRLGMDGFLYVAVGDKGIPQARGSDGATITMSGGGVIRVRPDGSNLEVVSTGERNPLSVVLSSRDDVFSFGNDDDSRLWPNSLTHHIVGGHYGYPFEFLSAPHRALPIVAGQSGGAGAQGVCSNDDGLPDRFRGNLFFCDWGLQSVARYEVEPKGATFRLVRREPIVEKGDLADFRPFSIAPTADGSGFWVVDWAYNGWLGAGPPTGRLFRLTYTGADRKAGSPRRVGTDLPSLIAGLDHPTFPVRLANQRRLAQRGLPAVGPLAALLADHPTRLGGREGVRPDPENPRMHALWALDAIGSAEARRAIRRTFADSSPALRAQAIRSEGINRDSEARAGLIQGLGDPEPTVRREAAIALGRLPGIDGATRSALFLALKEPDPTVAWSIRRAIRVQDAWDATLLAGALADPPRRDSALTLADGSYSPEVVKALAESLASATKSGNDPAWRARLVAALGGLYAKVPAWSGQWFGTNPVVGPRPKATEPWDQPSMDAVLLAMARALRDPDPGVRRQGIIACINVGARATPLLRAMLDPPGGETDPVNTLAVVRFLGEQRDAKAVSGLARKLGDPKQTEDVRLAALDALGQLNGPAPLNARLMVLYDSNSPDALIARALPALGRAKLLPSNDLVGFLDHKSGGVRAAALGAFPPDKPLSDDVIEAILLRFDDPTPEVRVAAASAASTHRLKGAIPRLLELSRGSDGPLRAEATRALAAMPDRRSIPALVAALNDRDPDLRRDALVGLTAIRGDALPELTAMAGRGEFVGPSALAVERLLATFHPLTEWRVIGPYPRATGPIFGDARAIDFLKAELGLGGRSIAWRPRIADPKTGTLSLDDLKPPAVAGLGTDSGAEALTAFAVAEVVSDRDRAGLLIVNANGPTIVAVDDRPLAQFAWGAAGETVRIDLKSGVNRVLLRARQGGSPWSVRVELSDPAPEGSRTALAARPATIHRERLRAFALKHAGDPKNGEAIFNEVGGVGCVRCHGSRSQPATNVGLGPDLTGLALKYDKAEIIRSILEPSSRISVGYTSMVVDRNDGTTAEGLLRSDTTAGVELTTADGRSVRIPAEQVAQKRISEASIMPEGLVDGLKAVEFADLVAYLASLKQVTPTVGSER